MQDNPSRWIRLGLVEPFKSSDQQAFRPPMDTKTHACKRRSKTIRLLVCLKQNIMIELADHLITGLHAHFQITCMLVQMIKVEKIFKLRLPWRATASLEHACERSHACSCRWPCLHVPSSFLRSFLRPGTPAADEGGKLAIPGSE